MWEKNKQDQNSVGIMALYHGPVVLLKTWHLQEGPAYANVLYEGWVGWLSRERHFLRSLSAWAPPLNSCKVMTSLKVISDLHTGTNYGMHTHPTSPNLTNTKYKIILKYAILILLKWAFMEGAGKWGYKNEKNKLIVCMWEFFLVLEGLIRTCIQNHLACCLCEKALCSVRFSAPCRLTGLLRFCEHSLPS